MWCDVGAVKPLLDSSCCTGYAALLNGARSAGSGRTPGAVCGSGLMEPAVSLQLIERSRGGTLVARIWSAGCCHVIHSLARLLVMC